MYFIYGGGEVSGLNFTFLTLAITNDNHVFSPRSSTTDVISLLNCLTKFLISSLTAIPCVEVVSMLDMALQSVWNFSDNFSHTAHLRFGVPGKTGSNARFTLETALPKACALWKAGDPCL